MHAALWLRDVCNVQRFTTRDKALHTVRISQVLWLQKGCIFDPLQKGE